MTRLSPTTHAKPAPQGPLTFTGLKIKFAQHPNKQDIEQSENFSSLFLTPKTSHQKHYALSLAYLAALLVEAQKNNPRARTNDDKPWQAVIKMHYDKANFSDELQRAFTLDQAFAQCPFDTINAIATPLTHSQTTLQSCSSVSHFFNHLSVPFSALDPLPEFIAAQEPSTATLDLPALCYLSSNTLPGFNCGRKEKEKALLEKLSAKHSPWRLSEILLVLATPRKTLWTADFAQTSSIKILASHLQQSPHSSLAVAIGKLLGRKKQELDKAFFDFATLSNHLTLHFKNKQKNLFTDKPSQVPKTDADEFLAFVK